MLLFTDFYTLDIIVREATVLYGTWRRHRQGKHSSAFVKLQKWGFSHVSSINSRGKPSLLTQTNMDFARSVALCFTQTWLSESIPDLALQLPAQTAQLSCQDGRKVAESASTFRYVGVSDQSHYLM